MPDRVRWPGEIDPASAAVYYRDFWIEYLGVQTGGAVPEIEATADVSGPEDEWQSVAIEPEIQHCKMMRR